MDTALLLAQTIQTVKASTRNQLTQGLLVPMEIPPLHHGVCLSLMPGFLLEVAYTK